MALKKEITSKGITMSHWVIISMQQYKDINKTIIQLVPYASKALRDQDKAKAQSCFDNCIRSMYVDMIVDGFSLSLSDAYNKVCESKTNTVEIDGGVSVIETNMFFGAVEE